jgi:hypothetical protein
MASQCRHIIWGCFDSTTSERPDKTNFCVPDIYVDKKNPPNEKIESKRHKRILGREKVSHGGGGGHLIPAGHSSQTPA